MNIISKEILFSYFAGHVTAIQKRSIQEWLKEPQNAEQYYIWLEEWERQNAQFVPDTESALDNYINFMGGEARMGDRHQITEANDPASYPSKRPIYRRYLAIVASLALVVTTIFVFRNDIQYRQYATTDGEIKTITLPDSSVVVLNQNSTLDVPRLFSKSSERVAYLNGNARFNIRHTFDNRLFVVNTSNNYQIQVLGTEFDVYSTKDSSRVYLKNGCIKLIAKDSAHVKPLIIKPDQVVKMTENKPLEVNTDQKFWQYKAWEEHKFKFNATPMKEVATMLEEQFGYRIVIKDDQLSGKVISGIYHWEKEEDILDILSEMLDFDIERTRDSIILWGKK